MSNLRVIFYKTIIVLIFLFASSYTVNAQQLNYYTKEYNNVFKIARSLNKLILITFYTDWCINCKKMDENVFTDKNLVNLINNNYIPLHLNAELFDVMDICDTYQVKSYPTSIIIDANGKLINKLIGYYGVIPMTAELKKAAHNNLIKKKK